MSDVSRERENKGDIIIPIVAFANWDRENWLVQCQTESLCRAEPSFPQRFPSAFLTQPSLCFLEEYHPPLSRLNTFCFLLLPFSLCYSFFLSFLPQIFTFLVWDKLSLTPSFTSCTLLSISTGLRAFLAGFLWAPQGTQRGLAEGWRGLCHWDFPGRGSLVCRQKGHSMARAFCWIEATCAPDLHFSTIWQR